MRNKLGLLLVTASFLCLSLCASAIRAQTAPGRAGQIITRFRIQPKSGGPLFVTINGAEKKIANEAVEAWIIDGGRKLAYMTSESPGQMGAGGTLIVFDPQTNKHKKLTTWEDDFTDMKVARSGDGKTAMLMETSGAENCAPAVTVIDPARGEVFSEGPAQVLSIKGDTMLLGYFREAEWDKNCESKKMKAYKTKSFSLTVLLKRRVVAPAKS
jgi:hypothetical protein